MFDHVNETLEKDEEKEKIKEDIVRKRENELLKKIDKKNEEINKLKSNYEDTKQQSLRSSRQDFSNTFDRIEQSKSITNMAAIPRSVQKQIEREKQDKEFTQMEAEDFRMKQIRLEEKRIRELKQLEEKLMIEANKRLELEIQKQSKLNERDLKLIEEKITIQVEEKKWKELEELEAKRKEREANQQKEIIEK